MNMIYGTSYDGSANVFLGAYENLRVVKNAIDFLFSLQNQWIRTNFVRVQEIFCNACEDARVLECEIC